MEKKTIWQKIWSTMKKIWNAVKCIWTTLWSFVRHPIRYVKTLIPRLKKAGWLERILLIGAPIVGCILLGYAIWLVSVLILWCIVASAVWDLGDSNDDRWREEVVRMFFLRHDREPESFDEALRG